MKRKFAVLGLGLSAILLGAADRPSGDDDPLLRPIAPEHAARWLAPQAPLRIHGNSFLVGFGGLNVGLIQTDAGLILIDGAVPQAVPEIEANIRRLGFRIEDVKLILSTEPHYDHAGGIAALARDSGATVVASHAAAEVLRRGRSGSDDPQAAWLPEFPPVSRIRTLGDGEELRLGSTVVTARATPGHTPGSMSWSWRSCEKGKCLDVVFASSLNPIAADGFRFTDPQHRSARDSFRDSFRKLRSMPCDILITPHPDQSGGDLKLAKLLERADPNPFIDPNACRSYAEEFEALFEQRLAKERDEVGGEAAGRR